jgi:hypothetical protein
VTLDTHLSDETLSTLLDGQLTASEAAMARAHLATCAACAQRLAGLQSVASMLRGLGEVDLPRDFSLGPRVVVDPPNVIRLQRWYTWSRAAAASLAALFVFLIAGSVYTDLAPRPAANNLTLSRAPLSSPVPAAARESAPAPASSTGESAAAGAAPKSATDAQKPAAALPPPKAAAPALAQASPAAPAAAQRAVPEATPDASDQVTAATSVSPLATPTSPPVAQLLRTQERAEAGDPTAQLRLAAIAAGVLAALALFMAIVVRHRLRAAKTLQE